MAETLLEGMELKTETSDRKGMFKMVDEGRAWESPRHWSSQQEGTMKHTWGNLIIFIMMP